MKCSTHDLPARRIATVLLWIVGMIALAQPSAQAQSSGWQQPRRMSPLDQFGWFSDIAVDETGRAHVVWGQTGQGYEMAMYSTSSDGVAWTPPLDALALPTTGAAPRPSLLADGRGELQLIMRNDDGMRFQRMRVDEVAQPSLRPEPQELAVDGAPYFSSMGLGPDGTVHIVITDNPVRPECPTCFHVYYRSLALDRRTWTAARDVSLGPEGAAKPRVVVDKKNNIFVIWESGMGGGLGRVNGDTAIRFIRSADRGETWSEPLTLSALRGDNARSAALGVDGSGTVVVVWINTLDDRIYFTLSRDAGQTWSAPARITDVTGNWDKYKNSLDSFDMVADADGALHLAMVGRIGTDSTSLDILHLTWSGQQWSAPQAVASYRDDMPEWTRIKAGLGNQLHMTWSLRDAAHVFDTDNGRFTVWYARGTVNARAMPPRAVPSVTPPATAQPRSVLATARPVPSVSANKTEVSMEDLKNEYGMLRIAALGALPIVLVFVVALLFKRRGNS